MVNGKAYVWQDEDDVMRVGKTRVMLEGVIYPFKAGQSPESIRRSYPALELEEVYGAITYYLANKQEVEAYLARQEALWEQLRAEQDRNPPPVVQRLKARLAARANGREGAG